MGPSNDDGVFSGECYIDSKGFYTIFHVFSAFLTILGKKNSVKNAQDWRVAMCTYNPGSAG